MSICTRQERFCFRKDKSDNHQKIRLLPYTIERCTIWYTEEEEEEEEEEEDNGDDDDDDDDDDDYDYDDDGDDDGGDGDDDDGGGGDDDDDDDMIYMGEISARMGIASPPSHKHKIIFMRKKDLSRASSPPAGSPPVNLSMI